MKKLYIVPFIIFVLNIAQLSYAKTIEDNVQSEYAPQQFIIKFKSEGNYTVREDFTKVASKVISSSFATENSSNSLDILNQKYQVQSAQRLLKHLEGMNTSLAKEKLQQNYEELKLKYPSRSLRAPE